MKLIIFCLLITGCSSLSTQSTNCRKVGNDYVGQGCFDNSSNRVYRAKFY